MKNKPKTIFLQRN